MSEDEYNNGGDDNQGKEAYEQYCRDLAKANGVPPEVVSLLMHTEQQYGELQELLMEIEDVAGIAELENKDGLTFSQAAWDYAIENGAMPFEELICILGKFHGKAQED